MLPVVLYLAAWRLGVSATGPVDPSLEPVKAGGRLSSVMSTLSLVLLAALLAHIYALYLGFDAHDGVHIGFAHVLSAALWVGIGLLWLDGDHPHSSAMRALVLPIAAVLAPLPLLFPGALIGDISTRPLFLPHLIVGVLAYAVLLLAVVHALLMALAERALHGDIGGGRAGLLAGALERLPPLLGMERLLFRLLSVGFVLLTLTAVSGLFFAEEIFGRSLRLDHKTIFTLLAWCVFGILLLGRRFWGWRGRTALRLTIIGFVVVLLGYAGSRFVLEVILGRI
ncbi:MAG: cytochrome c biogenesis protein CcsA [Burkholderiaceae bacterium]